MKEALNQFMSAYLTNFRLSDFHPGPICQTTPPFRFAIFSLHVSPLYTVGTSAQPHGGY